MPMLSKLAQALLPFFPLFLTFLVLHHLAAVQTNSALTIPSPFAPPPAPEVLETAHPTTPTDPAFAVVPTKVLIRNDCFSALNNSSICQRSLYTAAMVDAASLRLLVRNTR